MKYSSTPKIFLAFNIAIYAVVAAIVLLKPTQMLDDSYGYVDMYLNRPPSYPIFLAALQSVFGSYFLVATKFFQLAFGLFSVHYLIKTLQKTVTLHAWWYALLTIIICIPYVYNHYVANRILTEAIAYPLYLLITASVIHFSFFERRKHLLYAAGLLFILLLTRKQFLFFIPIIVILLSWVSFREKNFKKNIPLLLLFIALPFISSTVDKTYHYFKHGHFVITPWNGIHLLGTPLFLAAEEDIAICTNDDEKMLFSRAFAELKNKNLNVNHITLDKGHDIIGVYEDKYPDIVNNTIYPIGMKMFSEKNYAEDEALIQLDKLTSNMSFPLLFKNFGSWISLYVKNVIYGFENSKYLLLYIVLFCFSLLKIFQGNRKTYILVAILTSFVLANVCIVATGMHTLKRFLFYNDWVLFFIVFLLLDAASKSLQKTKREAL